MSTIPRDIFGLETAEIKKGNRANLTIFTPEGKYILTSSKVVSASKNNPFIGKELAGKVLGIINNNQISINK